MPPLEHEDEHGGLPTLRALQSTDDCLKGLPLLQIKTVATPGFGPIFGLALDGSVFGIGGFESPI